MTRPRLIAFKFLAAFLLSKLSLPAHAECGDSTTCRPCMSSRNIDSCTWCSFFYGRTEMEMGVCVERRWEGAAYACANAAASLTTPGNNLSGLGFSLAPARFACATKANNLLINTNDPTCRGCVTPVNSDGLPIDQHWCSLESPTHTGGLCVGSEKSCESLKRKTQLTSSAVRTSSQDCCETRTNCGTCETADGCAWCSLFYGHTEMEMGVCIYRGGVGAAAACTNARSTLSTLGNNLSGLGFSLAPPQTACATLGNNLLINASDPSCRGCVTRVDSDRVPIDGHWCPLASTFTTSIEHSGGGLCLTEGATCQSAFAGVSDLVVGQDADTLMECCSMRQQCSACGEGRYCMWCNLSESGYLPFDMGFCVPREASEDRGCSTEALALVGSNLGGLGLSIAPARVVCPKANNLLINTNDPTCTGCVTRVDSADSRIGGHWCPLERNGVKGGVCLGDEEYCSSSLSTFRDETSQTVTATEQCPEYCSRVRDCGSCMSTDGCSWCALSKEGADQSLRGMGVCVVTGSSDQNSCSVHLSTVGHNLAALGFSLAPQTACATLGNNLLINTNDPTCRGCVTRVDSADSRIGHWCPLATYIEKGWFWYSNIEHSGGGLCLTEGATCQSAFAGVSDLVVGQDADTLMECCSMRQQCFACGEEGYCTWCSLSDSVYTPLDMGFCVPTEASDDSCSTEALALVGSNLGDLGFNLTRPTIDCTTSGNNVLINTNDATCTGCVTHVDTTESRFTGHWCPLERNGVNGGVCLGDEEFCSSSLSTFRGRNSSQAVTATEQC